jgi:hypothetical protein
VVLTSYACIAGGEQVSLSAHVHAMGPSGGLDTGSQSGVDIGISPLVMLSPVKAPSPSSGGGVGSGDWIPMSGTANLTARMADGGTIVVPAVVVVNAREVSKMAAASASASASRGQVSPYFNGPMGPHYGLRSPGCNMFSSGGGSPTTWLHSPRRLTPTGGLVRGSASSSMTMGSNTGKMGLTSHPILGDDFDDEDGAD